MQKQKGFTLIELLVVIAIIGILSAIVLASVNQARSKAQDSKVQAHLAGMRAAAEIYYGSHSNKYGNSAGSADCSATSGGLFADSDSGMLNLASSTPGLICGATDTQWAAAAPLISDPATYWCVDNTGISKAITSFTSSSVFTLTAPECPAS